MLLDAAFVLLVRGGRQSDCRCRAEVRRSFPDKA